MRPSDQLQQSYATLRGRKWSDKERATNLIIKYLNVHCHYIVNPVAFFAIVFCCCNNIDYIIEEDFFGKI